MHDPGGSLSKKLSILAGVLVPLAAIALLIGTVLLVRRRQQGVGKDQSAMFKNSPLPQFTSYVLPAATDDSTSMQPRDLLRQFATAARADRL